MGFNASKQLTKLDYTFVGAGDVTADMDGAQGTVPEPSQEMLNTFTYTSANAITEVNPDIELPDDADNPASMQAVLKAMRKLTVEQLNKVSDLTMDALCQLTRNNPPREVLDAAGVRAAQGFTGWLMEELAPKEQRRATTR